MNLNQMNARQVRLTPSVASSYSGNGQYIAPDIEVIDIELTQKFLVV